VVTFFIAKIVPNFGFDNNNITDTALCQAILYNKLREVNGKDFNRE